jgi:hypothetical protein
LPAASDTDRAAAVDGREVAGATDQVPNPRQTVYGGVMVRRFGRAVAATVCSVGFLYVTIVSWLWWSQPPFDLSGTDGQVTSNRLRSGSVLWPALFSVLTSVAIVLASVAWRRARHLPPPPFHRLDLAVQPIFG